MAPIVGIVEEFYEYLQSKNVTKIPIYENDKFIDVLPITLDVIKNLRLSLKFQNIHNNNNNYKKYQWLITKNLINDINIIIHNFNIVNKKLFIFWNFFNSIRNINDENISQNKIINILNKNKNEFTPFNKELNLFELELIAKLLNIKYIEKHSRLKSCIY